jgi:hypothetical protein
VCGSKAAAVASGGVGKWWWRWWWFLYRCRRRSHHLPAFKNGFCLHSSCSSSYSSTPPALSLSSSI